MSTCKVKSNGYSFEFHDQKDQFIKSSIFIDNFSAEGAKRFISEVKEMASPDEDARGASVFSVDYQVDINGYRFKGTDNVLVTRSDVPGEVLVSGSYKSIIQIGPSTVSGSGRTIVTTICVKIEDILNCHPDLM